MAPRVDPIAEGPETEAFWAVIEGAALALEHLQARDARPPDGVLRAARATYRLSYLCAGCPDEHRVEGTYEQVTKAVQILVLQSCRSVLIETLDHALLCDTEEADAMVEEADPEDGAMINNRLQEQFFSRKP